MAGDILMLRKADLLDDAALWALRVRRYSASSPARWILVRERDTADGKVALQCLGNRLEPIGRIIEITPTVSRSQAVHWSLGAKQKAPTLQDQARAEAFFRLADAGNLRTQRWLLDLADRVARTDDAERRKRTALARTWSVIETHDLRDGTAHLLTIPVAQAGSGGRTHAVVTLRGDTLVAVDLHSHWSRPTTQVTFSHPLPNAAEPFQRGLQGEGSALAEALRNLDDLYFLTPSDARTAWNLLLRQDAEERLKAEGRLTSVVEIRRDRKKAEAAKPLPLRIAERRELEGIIGVTLLIPAEREVEFRRLADAACKEHRDRLKSQTRSSEVVPLTTPNTDLADPMTIARQREAIIRPLAQQERIGRKAAAEAAARLNAVPGRGDGKPLSIARVYSLVKAYRAAPKAETLLPSKGGRPTGLKAIDERVERVVEEFCRAALAADPPPSGRALVKQIRERCSADGLRAPDKETVKDRLDALRQRIEGEKILAHHSGVHTLATFWKTRWTQGISGSTTTVSGVRLRVAKRIEGSGYDVQIGDGRPFGRTKLRAAQDEAIEGTLLERIRQQPENAGADRWGPWVIPSALLDEWTMEVLSGPRRNWNVHETFVGGYVGRFMHFDARLDSGRWRARVGPNIGDRTDIPGDFEHRDDALRAGVRLALEQHFRRDTEHQQLLAAERAAAQNAVD